MAVGSKDEPMNPVHLYAHGSTMMLSEEHASGDYWIHDTYLILIRMFPDACPPTTLLSMNHTYDPHFHVAALDFRQQVIDLLCCAYEDDVPADRALDGKVIRGKKPRGGPLLRRKATSLMKHPRYRDAHATDDHFMTTMFVAGLCGGRSDEGMKGVMEAEDWELTNMCNSQSTLGNWVQVK
ncbi:hypothetical protein QQZ08_008015 [Neonectria magnoliae]|uniref:Uncharacterized protein n=1 Tax=Neonectria magnoliae TaxID=2732573 RepID=A0ABR1HX70_9HYPO